MYDLNSVKKERNSNDFKTRPIKFISRLTNIALRRGWTDRPTHRVHQYFGSRLENCQSQRGHQIRVSPIRIAPRLSEFQASISAWKKRSIPSEHRGTNGGELMELGGVRPSVYKALSNRRYLPLERKFRVAETGFAGKLGGAGQDRRNSSRTRPDTRSNQFASPETMSSPLLSEPIVLTAPSLISGIDAVRSSWSCSPVVLPGSFILSPPLSFSPPFFLSCDFYSKFNRGTKFFTKEEGEGEEGKKFVRKNKKAESIF